MKQLKESWDMMGEEPVEEAGEKEPKFFKYKPLVVPFYEFIDSFVSDETKKEKIVSYVIKKLKISNSSAQTGIQIMVDVDVVNDVLVEIEDKLDQMKEIDDAKMFTSLMNLSIKEAMFNMSRDFE